MGILIAFISILCASSNPSYFPEQNLATGLSNPQWISFSAAGADLFIGGGTKIAWLQKEDRAWITKKEIPLKNKFCVAEISDYGNRMVYSDGKSIFLFDLEKGTTTSLFDAQDQITACCTSFGDFILAGDAAGYAYLWDLNNQLMIWQGQAHTGQVQGLAFSPLQDSFFTMGKSDHTVKEWDIGTRLLKRSLQIDKAKYGELYAIKISPFMGVIAVACVSVYRPEGIGFETQTAKWEDLIVLLDIETGNEIGSLKGHLEKINSLSFSPDGKYIASGADDCSIGLWSTESVKEAVTIDTDKKIRSVSISPTGCNLAALDGEGKCTIWRLEGISSSPLYTFSKTSYVPPVISLPSFEGKKKLVAVIAPKCKEEKLKKLPEPASNILQYEMLKTGRFRVIERERMEEVLKEVAFSASGMCDPSEMKQLGNLLSCDQLVIFDIAALGEKMLFSARLVDVITGEVILQEREEYQGQIENISLPIGVLSKKMALKVDQI